MAMLAEPRQRKRYNLAPRGKALYEDDSRFGTRMLEKMGWTKGNGLGPRQDGNKDFVRVRYKNDSEGLGFEDRNDQWTQHESDFNGLLKSLGNDTDTNADPDAACDGSGTDAPATVGFGFQPKLAEKVKISGESLEEKSKKSRSRVHYHKFTRGKDLTRYSEKDLANIFGRKSLAGTEGSISAEKPENSGGNSTSTNESDNEEHSFGVVTVKSGKCINDYFKTKMEVMRKKLKNTAEDITANEGVSDYDEPPRTGFGFGFNQESSSVELSSIADHGASKKSKSKKRKHRDEDRTEKTEECNAKNEGDDGIKSTRKKSKKKSKHLEDGENVNEIHLLEETMAQKEQRDENIANQVAELPECESKKIKHKRRKLDDTGCDTSSTVVDNTDKPRKNKKVKNSAIEVCAQATDICTETTAQCQEETEVKAKKKKSKKDKKHVEVQVLEDFPQEVTNDETEKRKERKTKKPKHSKEAKQTDPETDTYGSILPTDCEGKTTQEDGEQNDEILPSNDSSNQVEQTMPIAAKSTANTFRFPDLSFRRKRNKTKENPTDPITKNDEQAENNSEADNYKISAFGAEKFFNVDIDGFPGSNFSRIVGYGLSHEIKIELIRSSNDSLKIDRFYNNVPGVKKQKRSRKDYTTATNEEEDQIRPQFQKRKKPKLFVDAIG